ncbi:MAG: hypothetical protein A3B31_01985 [Candidatus Komeilibacteria bacterium RIFCSPLOWO2_01_FULL_53_11]|uniref:Uncharacterized protein n=1 Tax=Candidatus Komeilibacteria bacterium RIFCSPLOWO2_01_FULL_53_11 TaxID=1798552 RepID=A0A1G2BSK0_9BACT|nr:MAG: hypothetical protein A3B31_01985 [Candidatus Komeilibacteria bacterium RIFCSPLOWO2_01_FULL_53_11]
MNQTSASQSFFGGVVLAGIVVLVVVILWILLRRRDDGLQFAGRTMPSSGSPARESSQPAATVSPAPEIAEVRTHDLQSDRFKRLLREWRAAGDNGATAITEAVRSFGGDIDETDLVDACAELDFSEQDIAGYLTQAGFGIDEIAEHIERNFKMDAGEWVSVLWDAAKGTPAERASAILNAVHDMSATDLIQPLLSRGCSPADVASVLCHECELSFGEMVQSWPTDLDVPTMAELAKASEVDLTDEDEYRELREHLEFDKAAKLLCAAGCSANDVVVAEHDFDDYEFEDAYRILREAGFPPSDALTALVVETDNRYGDADVMLAYLDHTVSEEEIAQYIVDAGIDPDTLEEELNDQDVETRDRVKIMHRVLFPELYPGVPVASEASQTASASPEQGNEGEEAPVEVASDAVTDHDDHPIEEETASSQT